METSFFLLNIPLKWQLALDSFNLSKCGGLTYSLKPSSHADSLSRFFSKRNRRAIGKCQKDWLLYFTMCIFNERLSELTPWDTEFTVSEQVCCKKEEKDKEIPRKPSVLLIIHWVASTEQSISLFFWLYLFYLHFCSLLHTYSQVIIIRSLRTPADRIYTHL